MANKRVVLTLTNEQYTELENEAQQRSLSVREYVKRLVLGNVHEDYQDPTQLDHIPIENLRLMLSDFSRTRKHQTQALEISDAIRRRYKR